VNGVPRSAEARVETSDSLLVSCTPEVKYRGEPVTCTASTKPAGAKLEIQSWSFEGEGLTIPGDTRSATWEGPLVISGTVHLVALVNGKELRQKTDVEVTPRSWPNNFPKHAVEYTCSASSMAGCPLRYPPVNEYDLGATVLEPNTFGVALVPVEQGPNHGFWYIGKAPIQFTELRTYLNPVLFDSQDKFYEKSKCTQPELLADVRAHEATHVRFLLEGERGTTINAPLEKMVMRTSGDEFADSAYKATRTMVNTIQIMMANEKEIPANDPRRQEFPKIGCDIGLLPNK
jgi:hypothetical protein